MAQIGQQLRAMNREQTIYCLQFNNNLAIHQHIHAVSTIQSDTFIVDRQWYFAFY